MTDIEVETYKKGIDGLFDCYKQLENENEQLKAQIPHYTDAALQVPTEPGWYLGYCYGEDETPEDAGVAMVCWDGTKWHGELDLQVTVLQWTFIPKPEVKA